MIVTNLAIKNRTTVYVVSVCILVFGTYAYFAMPRESAPDVKIPYIFVTTNYSGVSPADMESSVTIKIENKLKSLRDVKEINSTSAEGLSQISIEFDPTIDIDDALQKVRDKVDQAKGEIPQEADDPTVREVNISDFPIMMINVAGDAGLVRLKELADDMKDEIEGVRGVLEANVLGALEREIRIEVDPDRLAAYRVPVGQLIQLVANENVNVSGGSVDTAEAKFQLRVPGEFVDPREIETLVVLTQGGKPVYLTDIAKIRDTFKDRTSFSRINGKECVTISVQKRSGENAIKIIDQIKVMLDRWRERVPSGVSIEVSLDESKIIRDMVEDLENNMISGFILVAGIVFLTMGWRNAIFVSLAIPMSMCGTFVVLHSMDITLNFVTLFSLILALGMFVDDAIVMVENIYRFMQDGHSRIEAARLGAAEVAWPVTTSALTTGVAFVPLLFWPTIIGEFMSYLPITVIISLVTSLFVGLVVSPALGASAMKVTKEIDFEARRRNTFLAMYEKMVRVALANRAVTIVLFAFMLVATVALYVRYGAGVEFFPDVDPNRAFVNIKAPEGTSLDRVNELSLEVESRLEGLKNVKRIVTNVGAGSGGGGHDFGGGGGGGLNTGQVSIDFPDFAARTEPSSVTTKRIRDAISDIPGAEITVKKEENGPPTGAPVNIEVSGEDFDTLAVLVGEIKERIKTVPGLVDLRDNYEQARPELRFVVDRNRAKLLGLDTNTIGFFLKTAVLGTKVGTFRQGNDEYDITLRLPPEARDEPEKVTRLYVPTMTGEMVPVSSLVNVRYAGGLGSITRVGQKRVITVLGNNEGVLPKKIIEDCRQRLAGLAMPQGYAISYTGENEDMVESQDFLAKAFVVALFLIAAVLVAEFDSLIQMLIIMSSVIMSLIGVFGGLLITGKPFGVIMTGIGVIGLAGVVVKNAIVLLDYVGKLRARGLVCDEALVRAGITRMRPVLLTAITAILGLVPMAVGISYDFINWRWMLKSESSQWWSQMAVATIFGLGVATALTLVVVPVMYSVIDSAKGSIGFPWKPPVEEE
jgi:multidrug efflux pump subunit AcrB